MATIGALNVKLSLSTQAFAKGVQSAQAGLAKMATAAKVASVAIAGIAVSAGGAFFLVSRFVQGFADANTQTIRLADQLDIGTEALIGLQHAAAQVAVTSGELNDGLAALNLTLGQVEAGGAFASHSLSRLGLDAARVASLPLDQAFNEIAGALSSLVNPGERAAAAFAIFGDKAKTLIPVLTLGPGGLQAAAEQAKRLGIAFDRIGGQKLLDAATAFSNLKAGLTGLFQTLAIKLAPVVTILSSKITEFLTQGPGLAARLAGFIDAVAAAIPGLAQRMQGLIQLAIKFGVSLLRVFQKVTVGLTELVVRSGLARTAGGGALAEGLKLASATLFQAERGLLKLNLGIKKNGLGNLIADGFKSASESIRKMAEEGKRLQQGDGSLAEMVRHAEALARAGSLFEQTRTPLEKFRETLAQIGFLFRKSFIDAQIFARATTSALLGLESALGLGQASLPQLLRGGTTEAASAIFRFQAAERQRTVDPAARLEAALRAGNLLDTQMLAIQRRIAQVVEGVEVNVLGVQ